MSFVSTSGIVNKIIRDYRVVNMGWVVDANEWVKEALQYIGTTGNKVFVKKDFETSAGEISMPCDLEDLIGVVQEGCFMRFQGTDALEKYETTGVNRPYVDGRKVKFNKSGDIKGTLYYYTFMENCDGELLLVDDIHVTDAVSNYIVLKLMQGGMQHPVIDYRTAFQIWLESKAKASNYLNWPAPYEITFVLSEFVNPM